jgi:hypothetical protein
MFLLASELIFHFKGKKDLLLFKQELRSYIQKCINKKQKAHSIYYDIIPLQFSQQHISGSTAAIFRVTFLSQENIRG